tara:strand:+ start:13951 stop:16584 length:2634 start_codon:yes stop_codon:yes gene_type:complete
MARIYQPESYGDNFAGSAQSRGFNPVAAIDRSQQERERAKQAVENINREIDILGRDQQTERVVQSAQQNTERAIQTANQQAIKGLLSLSQSALKFGEFITKENERIESENQLLDSLGLGELPEGESPKPTPLGELPAAAPPTPLGGAQAEAQKIDVTINAETSAINAAASELEQDGSTENRDVAHQLRQSAAFKVAEDVKGNIYKARSSYPGFLQEALRLIPDDQKPRTLPEAQALLRSLNRQFFRVSGLTDDKGKLIANRNLVLRDLASTISTAQSKVANQLVTAAIKADQKANLTKLNSTVYSAVASDMSAEEVWKVASEGFANGNVGHTGFSAASNEQAMQAIIASAIEDGDVALLEGLEDTPKLANQPNGPTLGDEYAHLLGPAKVQAQEKRNAAIKAEKAEIGQQVESAIQAYHENPSGEAKAQLIEQLQRMPQTKAVRTALTNLTSKGFNNDPGLEAELAAAVARGEYIPRDVLDNALDTGRIRPEVHQSIAAQQIDIKVRTKADAHTKEIKDVLETQILGNYLNDKGQPLGAAAQVANMGKATRVVYATRVKLFQTELAKALAAEARSNPQLFDDQASLIRRSTEIQQELLKRPEFTLTDDAQKGIVFKADPGSYSTPGFKQITIAPGEQNFLGLSFREVVNNVPISEINAEDDLIVNTALLQMDVQAIIDDKPVSTFTSNWARHLGMSERAFLDAQLGRNGKPPIALIEQGATAGFQPKAAKPGADLNATTGFRHLQSMGFPTRGAAYITSAISHESTWVGMREWGQVKGDGTNRNGGLISWASWHDNPARLGAIEKYFGRPISEISETDQLSYMKHEMISRYPKAYRIFTNPSASSADLQWAVSNYWGFDPKYTGDRWVDAEALIKRS